MSTYKVLNLFGEQETKIIEKKQSKPNLFSDYDSFLDKFEVKKTTDDCYTPDEVYKCVLNHVNIVYDLHDKKIIRPFFPGGDYESIDYPDDCVVIDNPPFSILTQIVKFYLSKGIKFYLFAPHLTLFGSNIDCTHIVVAGDITYENGAAVKTSFLSNLYGDAKIIGDAPLHSKLKDINAKKKANLPKYVYPDNIITVSKIAYMVEKGIPIVIDKKHTLHYRGLMLRRSIKKHYSDQAS